MAVPGLTGVVAIGAGRNHSVAVDAAGRVWTWGSNDLGQLGDGTTVNRASPVLAATLPGVRRVAAGRDYTIALRPP